MKKPTLIAAALLLALLGLFFLLQDSSEKAPVAPDYKIASAAALDKIKIEGEPEILLVKKDGAWRLSQPLDYPVASSIAEDLDKAFAKGIGMDLSLGKADPMKYQLGPEAPKVTLYEGDKELASFRVGKDVSVKKTFAKRSFVQPAGQDNIYRAQAGLRELLVRDLGAWREKRVLDFKPEEVTRLEMSYSGKVVTLERQAAEGDKEEGWTSSEGYAVEPEAVRGFLSSMGKLRVESFAPQDMTPEAAGLDQPVASYTVSLGDKGARTLLIGAPKGEDRYVQIKGEAWIYKINASTQTALSKRMGHFRPKQVLALDKGQVQRVVVMPEDMEGPLTLTREADKWVVTAPEREEGVDQDIVIALLRTVDGMEAMRMAEKEITAEQAGLTPGVGRPVVLTLDNGATTTVLLGKEAAADKSVYARVEDGDIFVLAGFKAQKLNPRKANLVRQKG